MLDRKARPARKEEPKRPAAVARDRAPAAGALNEPWLFEAGRAWAAESGGARPVADSPAEDPPRNGGVSEERRRYFFEPLAPAPAAIQRKCTTCEVEPERSADRAPPVKSEAVLSSSDAPGSACPTCDEERVARSANDGTPQRSFEPLTRGGAPLPESERAFFEPRFGRDLGSVRIHSNAESAVSARAVAADAYAFGDHIVFDEGRYAPGSTDGRRLLAHELAHVVQQKPGAHPHLVPRRQRGRDAGDDGGSSIEGPALSQPGDALERDADAMAERVLRDEPPRNALSPAAPRGDAPIARVGPQIVLRQPRPGQPNISATLTHFGNSGPRDLADCTPNHSFIPLGPFRSPRSGSLLNAVQMTFQLSGSPPAGMTFLIRRTRRTAFFTKASVAAAWTLLDQEGPSDDSPGPVGSCVIPSSTNTIFSNDSPGISLIGSRNGPDGRPIPVIALEQVDTLTGMHVPPGTHALCYRGSFIEWVEAIVNGAARRIAPEVPWHSVVTAHMTGTPPRPDRMPGQANEILTGAMTIPGPVPT